MSQKLKLQYQNEVIPSLQKELDCKNIHEIPKVEKIKINRGLGLGAQNTKMLQKSIEEFRLITGQQPVVTKAKNSIAGFKIREEMELGLTVTLRREKMYSFLERLINLALPRIRDFQGLDPRQFDKNGNYNFGLQDQLIFPEIEYDQVDQMLGLNISIVTSTNDQKTSVLLLEKLGLPFKKS